MFSQINQTESYGRWSLRIAPTDTSALETFLPMRLPMQPMQSLIAGNDAALRLGPDEWLLLMSADSAAAFRERSRSFDRTHGPHASLVEVTHRSVGFEIRGAQATWILNSGCPLDLSDTAFAPGACTRTLYGKVEIVLWRRPHDAPTYYLECWRSFVPHLWSRLMSVAAECNASGAM